MRVVVHFPVAEVFFAKEARYIVLRSRVRVPVEASVSEGGRVSFVRFGVWPLHGDSEGFGSGSLGNFP